MGVRISLNVVVRRVAGTFRANFGAICLLELQGGMMASEIAALGPEDIHLHGSGVPHVRVTQGKTDSRPRVVPLVLGLPYIRKHLAPAIQWLRGTTSSGHSKALRKFLKDATGNPKITAHGLRHSFRANGLHCAGRGALVLH